MSVFRLLLRVSMEIPVKEVRRRRNPAGQCSGYSKGECSHPGRRHSRNECLQDRYGLQIAEAGLEEAVKKSAVIKSGVNCYLGKLTNENVAKAHGYEWTDVEELIATHI